MKKSLKALSLFLSIVLLFGCISVAASAARKEEYTPSILVPGIFQSEVFYYENGEVVCDEDGEPLSTPFFLDSTYEIVGDALINALIPISTLLISQEDKDEMAATAVADVLGRVLMEKQKCDENGKFINDVRATEYFYYNEELGKEVPASLADMNDHDREYVLDQIPIQRYIDIAGEENLYFFSYASFGNMIDTGNKLYDYIQGVKEATGAEKVNIVPISQGGSVANALMQIYADKGISMATDIDRILFIVPALDGTILMGEIFEYGLIDDDDELYSKMFPALMGDDEFSAYLINIVLRIMPNADLNNILDKAVDTLIFDYMRYSTLIWGLVASGNYPGAAAKYLNDESTVEIKRQTDWFYQAQLNSDANILQAVEDGVEVFDIVDYNVSLYELCDSWDDVNADGIIDTASEAMGAYSVGVDIELPDDYVRAVDNCTDPEHHDHSDPNNIVDANCGLLPETTFYFYNQNHERTASNNIIMFLSARIMTDKTFTSVYSDPENFPQFNVARNSKGLMRDLAAWKVKDVSGLTPELKAELDDAIAIADAAIENTNMPADEFDAAKANFDSVTKECSNYLKGITPGDDSDDESSIDFENILLQFFKKLSDFLFRLFQGMGFSEMTNSK